MSGDIAKMRKSIEHLRAELEILERDFERAVEVQWQRSILVQAEDVGIAQKGAISDPTAAIALDERRLDVRDAVQGAEAACQHLLRSVRAASAKLRRATAKWYGDV